jgi:hypothetical protein
MLATPGVGVGVVAPTVGTSPTVVARSATGVFGAAGCKPAGRVAAGRDAARWGVADAGAEDAAGAVSACWLAAVSCWRAAGAGVADWGPADWLAAGRLAAGWLAAGADCGMGAFVAAGWTAQAASGIRNTDASSAPAPPLRMRASKWPGNETWPVAAYDVERGQAGARVDIIYSIF